MNILRVYCEMCLDIKDGKLRWSFCRRYYQSSTVLSYSNTESF